MPQTYRVTWEIDLEAGNPVEAAQEAWRLMRNEGSIANVFIVQEHDTAEALRVDLTEVEEGTACHTCGQEYDDGGDGYDGECPDCADRSEVAAAEAAARAAGWELGGDGDGIIFNTKDYDSWKEAVSWPDDDKRTYSDWVDCCLGEDIEYSP